MGTVSTGRKVPSFKARATGGKTITSRGLAGRPYILYFYPKDSTPGCTTESQNFRDRYRHFTSHDVVVLGVSRDGLESHEKFRARQELPFDLISDPEEALCRLFDVIRKKNMYGRTVYGIERSTFLVDSGGVLAREWRKVRVKGHVDEVLAAVESLQAGNAAGAKQSN